MIDLSPNSNLAPGRTEKARGSVAGIYLRLLRYTWNYKARLIVSLALALVIAASFGALLIGIGTVVDLTFYKAPDAQAASPDKPVKRDPADKILEGLQKVNGTMESAVGWSPRGLEPAFTHLVERMRADQMRALIILCALVVVLSLLVNVARYFQEYYAGTVGTNISTDLGQEMYENLMRQSVGFFEARSSGEILARFANDIFTVNRGLAGVLVLARLL